jgi:hypothetical protein
MASKDPFQISGRWKLLVVPVSIGIAFLLLGTMGVVSPLSGRTDDDQLRADVVSDFYRLERAAVAYVADNGEFPAAAFDLTGGYDGGLVQRTAAPVRHQPTWAGPYLRSPLKRPAPKCFWSLAEPQCLEDADGDRQADELWVRLHRGYGELDGETAAWLDRVLDDARPDQGRVRVTDTWIWFEITEA